MNLTNRNINAFTINVTSYLLIIHFLKGRIMHKKIKKNIYEIDVGYPELSNTFASYIIVGDDVLIIDPGPINFYENLIRTLDEIGVSRKDRIYIALTHIHPDHYGAASKLVKIYPNSIILVHPRGVKHLINIDYLWESARNILRDIAEIFGKPDPIPREKLMKLHDNYIIELSDSITVKSIFTPGHATHHVSYFFERNKIMFLGDSGGLFIEGFLAPTTPFPFNYNKAISSIIKMLNFNPEYVAYTHFGIRNNATKSLLEYMGQLYLWFNIISTTNDNSLETDAILGKIIEIDPETREFMKKVRQNPVLSSAVMHSVYGFIKYIDKYIRQ